MKNLSTATLISTMRGLGFSSIWIFSALYIRNILGLSVFQDGIILTAGTAAAAIVQKFAGSLSDRVGHKKMVIGSMFVLTTLFLLLVLFVQVRSNSVYFVATFVSLTISSSAQMPSINSIVSESSEMKTRAFSVLRVGNNVGWGIGPAIGGFAISFSGFYYLFVFGFASSLVALCLSFLLENVKPSGQESVFVESENRLLLMLSFTAMLLFIVQAQETVTLSNYANIIRGLSYFQLGLLYMVNGLAVIATQGLVYRVIRRIGNFLSFTIGSVIYSAGFLSFAFVSNIQGMIISTLIFTVGEDFAFPSSSAMVALISRPERIGRNMGIYNSFISSGRAAGPMIGGAVLSLTSLPLEIWGATTITGFISTILFVFTFRRQGAIQEKNLSS